MNNAERYNFVDFTRDNYRNLIRIAKKDYVFRTYTSFDKAESFIIWRHDVDFSMHSARRLAQIEAEEGVQAVYFLLLHSEFYNLLESEITKCVREVLRLGHDIGLHFDSHFYNIQNDYQLSEYLLREKRILEEVFGRDIKVFSFHIPDLFTVNCKEERYAGMINTNAEYFQNKVGYCSDSNGYWRFCRLEDILKQRSEERLQILTHPEFWQDKAMPPRERVWRCIEGRAEKTKKWYNNILKEAGRINIGQ